MNIQAQIGPDTVITLPDFAFPAPRSGESKTATRETDFDSPVEPRPAITTDVTGVQASTPVDRPKLITYALALLGVTCLVCGCAAAATLLVTAGSVLPLVAVVCMLLGLFVIGQAVGHRPVSEERYDIR